MRLMVSPISRRMSIDPVSQEASEHTILGFLTLTLSPTITMPTLVFEHTMIGFRDQGEDHANLGS